MNHRDYYAECVTLLRDVGLSEQFINTSCLVDEHINDGFFGYEDVEEVVDRIVRLVKITDEGLA